MAFDKNSEIGDLAKFRLRHRGDRKAALAGGVNKPFGRQPTERLADGRDAGPVVCLHSLQPQPRAGIKLSEDDVAANGAVDVFPDKAGFRS